MRVNLITYPFAGVFYMLLVLLLQRIWCGGQTTSLPLATPTLPRDDTASPTST